MTENAGAAAPTTEQAVIAPAGSEQATPPQAVPQDDAAENAGTPQQETEQPEGEASPDEPRRLTRSQRQQRKVARLSTMVAEQAAELEQLRAATAKSTAESEPKETEYNGDWAKYQTDHAAWKAAQIISDRLDARDQRDLKRQIEARQRESNDDFLERVESIKPSVPDFDKTIQDFAKQGGRFADHVIEEIRDSDKGPMLAYHLAKNPDVAAELNALSPRDAAREIGRLEAKVSLPQPKRQTQAPAPLSTLKGGASSSKSPADMGMDEYVKWRKSQSAGA